MELNALWDQHVDRESLARKFPDLSSTNCICNEVGTCDVCLKHQDMKNDDNDGKRRLDSLRGSYSLDYSNMNSLERPSNLINSASTPAIIVSSTTLLASTGLNASSAALNTSYSSLLKDERPFVTYKEPDELADAIEVLPRDESSTSLASFFDKSIHPAAAFDKSSIQPSTNFEPIQSHKPLPQSDSNDSMNTLTSCKCGEDPKYDKIHDTTLPFPLALIWKEWLAPIRGGNVFTNFLMDEEKITDLAIAPWKMADDPSGAVTMPLGAMDGPGYGIPFADVREGMYRTTTRVLQLKHGIPFVPKTTPGLNTFKVQSVGTKHICFRNCADIVAMGIVTYLRICIVETELNVCRVSVYLELVFTGKGKVNVPKALAEKPTLAGIKLFYVNLMTYFRKHIKIGSPEDPVCHCADLVKDGFEMIYKTELPISVEKLWSEVYMVYPGGNAFTRAMDVEGWKGTCHFKRRC